MEYLVLGNDEQGIVAMCGTDVAFPCGDGGCGPFCGREIHLPPCCSPLCRERIPLICPNRGMTCCCYN